MPGSRQNRKPLHIWFTENVRKGRHCERHHPLHHAGKTESAAATGHVAEYGGQAIRELSMEGRRPSGNMTIEGGARAGMVAPDDTTFSYLEAAVRPRAQEFQKRRALETLHSDEMPNST